MTPQELNRDIKRLAKKLKTLRYSTIETPKTDQEYFDFIANEGAKEFRRLYYANQEMNHLSAQNIRLMLRMNLIFRAIQFPFFGIQIDL